MIQELLREDRLIFWDRLIRGESIDAEELDQLVIKLAHDASAEERVGSVFLLAAAKIARVGRRAMRRNLIAGLRYWFSHVGTKDRPPGFNSQAIRDAGLTEIMGLYLNWREAMLSVGGNPNDYSALKRLEKRLKEEYKKEWKRVFGSQAPFTPPDGR